MPSGLLLDLFPEPGGLVSSRVDFWQTVVATSLGVFLAFVVIVGLFVMVAGFLDIFVIGIRLINRAGTALMNRITGMDTYTRARERQEEKEDWWRNA